MVTELSTSALTSASSSSCSTLNTTISVSLSSSDAGDVPAKRIKICNSESSATVFVDPSRYENPSDYAVAIFEANGYQKDDVIQRGRSKQIQPTPQMIEAYSMEISTAVREGDLKTLQRLFLQQQQQNDDETGEGSSSVVSLDCCSRFGQHVLHIACLRGHKEVVEFLLHKAKVSVPVVDDMQRTPLHDACWSSSLNFDIVQQLIRIAPEMVLCPDKRGHTAFQYTRQSNWKEWIQFLSKNQNLLTLKDNNNNNKNEEKEER